MNKRERLPDELVDPETGERFLAGEGERYYKETKSEESPAKIGRDFMKLFISSAEKMYKELTPAEIVMVMRLAQFVSYTDCVLRKNGRGEVMGVTDVAEVLELDKSYVYRIFGSLEKKGVIGHHVTGSILKEYSGRARKVYTVNPFIYCKGEYVNRAVYDYYRKSGWGHID